MLSVRCADSENDFSDMLCHQETEKIKMRLQKLQSFLKEKDWKYEYAEENDCASIDFEHRGLTYHVWEFFEDSYGAGEQRGECRTHGRLRRGI